MQNLIIDSRIREIEYKYLSQFFNVIKLPLSNDVYEEISGHSDIFYTKINDKVIVAPNAKIKEQQFILGQEKVEKEYPKDVLYNVCQIGNKIIGSKYTDKNIAPDILVKQGYVKCSVAVTGDHSCITSDKGIETVLNQNNIDALYVEEDNINLLKKDGSISNMKGFIGGASLKFGNRFVLFGDRNNLNNEEEIIEHLDRYNLELIDFKELDIYDYGSGLIY